jgi:peptide/nickel transport system substrate-binding protein
MIFLKRKRLIFWLIKAYLKRWGKVIFTLLALGIIIFIILYFNRKSFISFVPIINSSDIGISADIPEENFPNNLPADILNQASRGLTKISEKGEVLPDLAKKWEVKDDGKTFVFYLNDGIYFSDGQPFTSSSINYNFADVEVKRPAKSVIVFKLKDKYSPFLVTVANKKIFKDKYVGISDYKIKDVNTKNKFINRFTLVSKKDKKKQNYFFYPSQVALKDAYVLGDVSKIRGINNLFFTEKVSLDEFKNAKISKAEDPNKIATVFLNTNDSVLSDKKIRKSLAYSLPEKFPEGTRAYTPYKKNFWANKSDEVYKQDIEYAKKQIEELNSSEGAKLKIELKTLRPYRFVAEKLAKSWKDIGVETNVVVIDAIPSSYQAFLGELPIFNDPDQYTLWHTGQTSNITNYKNLRIDKLLEDGRRTYDLNERKKIYSDFQKYLIDDMPAIFLYFPFTYSLERR